MIAKCSFNRNTAQKVLYGPTRLNGGGFCPFATKHSIGQIQYFLKHWMSKVDIGIAQCIAVSWAQMLTGVSWSILHNAETPLPHFQESHWFCSLRTFLQLINGLIRGDSSYVPTIQRKNDSHIMDHVLSSGVFTASDVCAINYVRVYLQAVTVSDIKKDVSSLRLFTGVMRGTVTDIHSATKWHTTYQAKPDQASL
jgi:hypothetical protein